MTKNKKIIAFKGFEKDLKCRGFQYEVGKNYEEKGYIECCSNGFHACKYPLDVFNYYSPSDGNGNLRKYALVEQSGIIKEDGDKIVSSKIKIKSELSIMDMVKFHVDYLKENNKEVDENTGDRSASTNTGDWSRTSVTQENSAAFAFGYQSRAMTEKGWIIIVDWRVDKNANRYIANIYTGNVGGKIKNKKIEPNTWYWFEDGELKSEKDGSYD